MNFYFDKYCEDEFWNANLTWYTPEPKLTKCLAQVGFTIIPNFVLLLFLPFEVLHIRNSKNSKIQFNFYNILRLCLCFFGLLNNFYQNYFTLKFFFAQQQHIFYSEVVSSLIKTLSFMILFVILNYHRVKGIITCGLIWIYLFINTSCCLVLFLDVILYNMGSYNKVDFLNISFNFSVNLSLLVLFFFTDDAYDAGLRKKKPKKNDIEKDFSFKQSPATFCSFPSDFMFSYFSQIVWSGNKKLSSSDDLWELEDEKQIDFVVEEFKKVYYKEMSGVKKNGNKTNFNSLKLVKVLIKTYGLSFLGACMAKFASDILEFANPTLLSLLIVFVQSDNSFLWHGAIIAILIMIAGLVKSVMFNWYFAVIMDIAMKIKSSLVNIMYTKFLKLSPNSKKEKSTGEIVNLAAVDANRFLELLFFLNLLWSTPFQFVLATYFLYQELGISIFFGIATMIVLIPINAILISFNKKYQVKQMKLKDERVKLMNEVLSGIKVLKLYGWENAFIDAVNNVRKKETNLIKRSYFINLITTFIFNSSSILIFVATFTAYIFLDENNHLTPQKAFVSIALFNILQNPINFLPTLVNTLVLTGVSIKRISDFLNSEELVEYITNEFDQENSISIIGNVNFSWASQNKEEIQLSKNNTQVSLEKNSVEKQGKNFSLKNINLKIKKRSFVAIVGQVGSGKSSLLSAFLGEMELLNNEDRQIPKINISEDQSISFASQQAWIQNNTLQKNILFGLPYDEKKYSKVINCCALEPDLKLLPGGDQTEIGEKGINLSGGQKQRISLARACYSDSNLVLLDDTLSAVDAHVGKHLIENVLSSETGLMKDKTRVLVTNQLNVLKNVDQIILLKDGEIIMDCDYEKFIEEEKKGNLNQYGIKLDKESNAEQDVKKEKEVSSKEEKITFTNQDSSKKDLIEAEKLEMGQVSFKDYNVYFKNSGYLIVLLSTLFLVCKSVFLLFSNLFLAAWSNNELTFNDTQSIFDYNKKQLSYYSLICLVQCVTDFFGNYFLLLGAISSSVLFHRQLLKKVMKSPMAFFDTTPIGRILNRFSKDIDVIDSSIPQSVRQFIQCLLKIFIALSIIIYKIPNTFILFAIILITFVYIQKVYVRISTQLRRLDSISRSPIYSHFNETISGSSTIRAYRVTESFINQSNMKTNINNKAFWLSVVGGRWLGIRLDCLGTLIVFFTAALVILQKQTINSGDAGLIVSYSMDIIIVLCWTVRMLTELESNVVSVERVNEYCKNIEEDSWEKDVQLPDNWPSEGKVQFVDYSTRYRQETDLVIRNLNVDFDSLQKVGIVGRTGAGKSSITLALFRLIEPASGKILIDNVDITKLGLHDLRLKNQALSIIPQDPVLFTGTLRWNLDPFNQYTDNEIYRSLELAHLDEFVKKLPEGIMYKISEGGENLSVGQRQLVCLARALLKKSKILVLDEATASVDYATDELIQKTIRTEFKNCTTITIAHRINTILDSDKILVLDKGEKIEYENPNSLLADTSSQFYSLAKSANVVN